MIQEEAEKEEEEEEARRRQRCRVRFALKRSSIMGIDPGLSFNAAINSTSVSPIPRHMLPDYAIQFGDFEI